MKKIVMLSAVVMLTISMTGCCRWRCGGPGLFGGRLWHRRAACATCSPYGSAGVVTGGGYTVPGYATPGTVISDPIEIIPAPK